MQTQTPTQKCKRVITYPTPFFTYGVGVRTVITCAEEDSIA